MDRVAAISLRENERGREIGAGWDPHWHQPSDVFATFNDQDFRLGLNAATNLARCARALADVAGSLSTGVTVGTTRWSNSPRYENILVIFAERMMVLTT